MRKFIVKEYCPVKEDMVVAGLFEWDEEKHDLTHRTSEQSEPYLEAFKDVDHVRRFIYTVMKDDENIINITEEE